ncbi:MAG: hypothetical protein Q7S56_02900 [Nanoarchaeota archaeon]|nr:hypothetical protein [Nanoarchaeota archaeon]
MVRTCEVFVTEDLSNQDSQFTRQYGALVRESFKSPFTSFINKPRFTSFTSSNIESLAANVSQLYGNNDLGKITTLSAPYVEEGWGYFPVSENEFREFYKKLPPMKSEILVGHRT